MIVVKNVYQLMSDVNGSLLKVLINQNRVRHDLAELVIIKRCVDLAGVVWLNADLCLLELGLELMEVQLRLLLLYCDFLLLPRIHLHWRMNLLHQLI